MMYMNSIGRQDTCGYDQGDLSLSLSLSKFNWSCLNPKPSPWFHGNFKVKSSKGETIHVWITILTLDILVHLITMTHPITKGFIVMPSMGVNWHIACESGPWGDAQIPQVMATHMEGWLS